MAYIRYCRVGSHPEAKVASAHLMATCRLVTPSNWRKPHRSPCTGCNKEDVGITASRTQIQPRKLNTSIHLLGDYLPCILNLSLKLLLGPVSAESERQTEFMPIALDGVHARGPVMNANKSETPAPTLAIAEYSRPIRFTIPGHTRLLTTLPFERSVLFDGLFIHADLMIPSCPSCRKIAHLV